MTDLPQDVIDILARDIEKFDKDFFESKLQGDRQNIAIRNSKNTWIPTTHWIAGFIWHYVQRANRENFQYDLTNIDKETLQYTQYSEGQYYGWHTDSGLTEHYKAVNVGNEAQEMHQDFINLSIERVRKLSFSLQLSGPEEYEGGNLQLIGENNVTYVAPRQKGSLILFDSRTRHRVCKITKGKRKSIVGWVAGPRWK